LFLGFLLQFWWRIEFSSPWCGVDETNRNRDAANDFLSVWRGLTFDLIHCAQYMVSAPGLFVRRTVSVVFSAAKALFALFFFVFVFSISFTNYWREGAGLPMVAALRGCRR
jgi:hypothetical protein